MLTVLIIILVSIVATLSLSLIGRFFTFRTYKVACLIVSIVTGAYFILLYLGTIQGSESTPVAITSTNHLSEECKVYNITVYDHPVYDNASRFVYTGTQLKKGESSMTVIEYDGAKEFWTVALNEKKGVSFFRITSSHSESKYSIDIDNSIEDEQKAEIAKGDIIKFDTDERTKDILILIDLLLFILLLIDLSTKWSKA